MMRTRLVAVLVLAALALSFSSCASVVLAAGKAVTDGAELVLGDAWLYHSDDPYGLDMFDGDNVDEVFDEFEQRYYSWHSDWQQARETTLKYFFNFDADDPYNW